MIIQLKGEVQYPITIDPSVWIFDDRKIILEQAFANTAKHETISKPEKMEQLFNQEIYAQKSIRPPVNKSIEKYERKQLDTESFVMPIHDFLENARPLQGTKHAVLKTATDDTILTLEQLRDALLLFSKKGKPLAEDGPVHLYFGDGSNQNNPIKGITSISIK